MSTVATLSTPLDALKRAIAAAGGQAALARACGVKQPTVWNWLHNIGHVPAAEHVLKVEAATGVSKHDLRPDIYPRDAAVPHTGVATVGAGGSSIPPSRAETDPMSGLNP